MRRWGDDIFSWCTLSNPTPFPRADQNRMSLERAMIHLTLHICKPLEATRAYTTFTRTLSLHNLYRHSVPFFRTTIPTSPTLSRHNLICVQYPSSVQPSPHLVTLLCTTSPVFVTLSLLNHSRIPYPFSAQPSLHTVPFLCIAIPAPSTLSRHNHLCIQYPFAVQSSPHLVPFLVPVCSMYTQKSLWRTFGTDYW